jgi:hypothetical protein
LPYSSHQKRRLRGIAPASPPELFQGGYLRVNRALLQSIALGYRQPMGQPSDLDKLLRDPSAFAGQPVTAYVAPGLATTF